LAEGQHGVQTEEPDEPSDELVVGDHLHQVLPVRLALGLEHAGGLGGAGQVGPHVRHQAGVREVVTAQKWHCALEDLPELGGVGVHGLVARPPRQGFLMNKEELIKEWKKNFIMLLLLFLFFLFFLVFLVVFNLSTRLTNQSLDVHAIC